MDFTNPYIIILCMVVAFMIGVLFTTYRKTGNNEKFRELILKSIDEFLALYDTSKLGKIEFEEKLICYVKSKVLDSNLSDGEKDILLNGKIINEIVESIVDLIFRIGE